ncbi:MAG: LytTR family DNA-binding domain-containing protein [Saprospiraceae bacterium]|nr:LytTR family DNA-binding domain-containing protein [Saprospiraceae bacterium]
MSYKVIIIEDEPPASKRLLNMLKKCTVPLEVIEILDSVEDSISYFKNFTKFDLIFMDVQLGDGLSFDIFKKVDVQKPIIFTTAYDEYTLKAFKVNSIDYLLKPIDQDDLEYAIGRFSQQYSNDIASFDMTHIVESIKKPNYKQRFLVKKGKQLVVIPSEEVAFFYSEDGYTILGHQSGSKHIIDLTIDQLLDAMNPRNYHRINRKMLVSLSSISSIHEYFNSRLKLDLIPRPIFDVIVSRDRVKGFKKWLNGE